MSFPEDSKLHGPASKTQIDWKSKDSSVQDAFSNFYIGDEFADIEFLVGEDEDQETFKTHKAILAARSPVFDSMFFESSTESEKRIIVRDIEPQAFKTMLRYIYTDDLPTGKEKDTLDLYEVADKYFLSVLKDHCEKQLSEMDMNPEFVCFVLETADVFGLHSVKSSCLRQFNKDAKSIFASEGFLNLQSNSMRYILENKTDDVPVSEIIQALIKWAENHATSTGQEVRTVLDGFLPFIGFENLPYEDWAKRNPENPEINQSRECCFAHVSLKQFL